MIVRWAPAQGFAPSPSTGEPIVGTLATTAQTAVLAYTPPADGGFVVYLALTVSATATVTASVTYTDLGGNARTEPMVANSLPAGGYSLVPVTVAAKGGHAVTLLVQATVQNAVEVTASIEGLV